MAVPTMTDQRSDSGADGLPEWEDPQVQIVYERLCNVLTAPGDEHWEGYVARHIVKALRGVAQQPMNHAPSDSGTAQALAHELFAHECFAFTGDGPKPHSRRCQDAAQRLEEWRGVAQQPDSGAVQALRDKLAPLKWHIVENTVNKEIIVDLIEDCQRLAGVAQTERTAQGPTGP